MRLGHKRNTGASGEIFGYSPDSVSLVLESGRAFTGDLPLPGLATEEMRAVTSLSWKKLLKLGARMIYPAYSDPFPVEVVRQSLAVDNTLVGVGDRMSSLAGFIPPNTPKAFQFTHCE